MSDVLQSMFEGIEQMFVGARIDLAALQEVSLDAAFFDNYEHTRIVNSFLFNFGKLQDRIGARLFRQTLYELKEIDTLELPMIDVLHHLERLHIIDDPASWETLREIRNTLAHEYPFEIEERVENIELAIEGFAILEEVYIRLRTVTEKLLSD